jgi:hypothetical protein
MSQSPNSPSLLQTDGANAGLASCVVTGTADGAILVYDVRVGRGSSGLKPVTSFQNAHSEEVLCILSRTHCLNLTRFPPRYCLWAAATIDLAEMVRTAVGALFCQQCQICSSDILSQSICFRAARMAILKCGICGRSRFVGALFCLFSPSLLVSRSLSPIFARVHCFLVASHLLRPSEHNQCVWSW